MIAERMTATGLEEQPAERTARFAGVADRFEDKVADFLLARVEDGTYDVVMALELPDGTCRQRYVRVEISAGCCKLLRGRLDDLNRRPVPVTAARITDAATGECAHDLNAYTSGALCALAGAEKQRTC